MANISYLSLSVPAGGHAECTGLDFNPDGTTPFTIECWLHLNGMGNDISVLKKDSALDFSIRNGRLVLSIYNQMIISSDGGNTLVDSEGWHHVAVTYSRSFVYFYINGNSVGCTSVRLAIEKPSREWQIGSNMDGRVRYLRIYNIAVDASDIKSYMFNTPSTDNVVADLDFSCNPPVNKTSSTSVISFFRGAAMRVSWPALRFKGTGYALPYNSTHLNPGGGQIDPYTIHTRIYIRGIQPYLAIITNGDNNMDYGIALFLSYDNDDKCYRLCALRGSDSNPNNKLVSNQILQTELWISVGCTYDGESLKLYIDGELTAQMLAGPILMPQEKANLMIGGMLECGRPTGINTFQGYMSRMEIWDVALSDEQMKLYTTTIPGIEIKGLVEAFDFTNTPLRSETSRVSIALCDNACFKELITDPPKNYKEYIPETINYDVDKEWLKQIREETDIDELTRKHDELFSSDVLDNSEELALVLGFEPTAQQKEDLVRRRKENEVSRNLLLGVTYHQMGDEHVLVGHYLNESQAIYKCHVSKWDECTLKRIGLVFLLIGGVASALFGIRATLTDKAINYISAQILTLASVLAILAAGEAITAPQIYGVVKQLSAVGVLKELLKMTVSFGFWALLRFLAKVTLTFLGVGWVDTIAILAATAITFGISYVVYVKLCRPLPAVTLREIRFNHNLARSDTSALNIRNQQGAIVLPEWVNGRSNEAAYSKADVAGVFITARFCIASIVPYTVSIRVTGGNILGAIASTNVGFILGYSMNITLPLANNAIAGAAFGRHQIVWNWEYQDAAGQWIHMAITNHTIYLTERLPNNPWGQIANSPNTWPWVEMFERSIAWRNGAVNFPLATQEITNSLYNSGIEYGGGGYLFSTYGIYNFNATQFVADMNNPALHFMECSECAAVIVLLANIWGNTLRAYYFANNGHVRTAYIRALGANVQWETHDFAYHVIAANAPALVNASQVYDGCVAVDSSVDPWNIATAHIQLVPGSPGHVMLFGPPSAVVIVPPYAGVNNYCDRLFENVPNSKSNININTVLPISII